MNGSARRAVGADVCKAHLRCRGDGLKSVSATAGGSYKGTGGRADVSSSVSRR